MPVNPLLFNNNLTPSKTTPSIDLEDPKPILVGSNTVGKKPEAKLFKKWVTSEVLPSIRKTGSYSLSVPKTYIAALENNREKNKGIYKITSPSGKIYIGQTINYEKRIKCYKRLECKLQVKLYNSFKKYGVQSHNFQLIEFCESNLLNERERYWQDYYNCIGNKGLNCRLTKSTDKSGELSEQTIRRMKGRIVSQETRKKLSNALKGKKKSIQSIENNRKSNIGRKMTIETREKISKSLKGRVLSEKQRENLRKCAKYKNLGRKATEETKKKMSKNSGTAKLVFNVQTGIFYDSCKKASESTSYMSAGFLNKKLTGWNINKTDFIYI